MPRVSTWLIRAAMVHFLSGSLIGAKLLTWKATGWFAFAPGHLPVHIEEMLVGWLVQLTMGVAFWILPRKEGAQPGEGSAPLWVVFGLINAGVLLVGLDPVAARGVFAPLGRLMETAAAAVFLAAAWHRQRAYRAATRRVIL